MIKFMNDNDTKDDYTMNSFKILCIISSGRKNGHTSKVISLIEDNMKAISKKNGDAIEFEKLFLTDFSINHCIGCRTCMDVGEERCPLKDDVPVIKHKIKEADAVIFASPVYVGDVNSAMKSLIDRLAYMCHRQEFYDKSSLLIATTNATSLKRTIHTMGAAALSWGFNNIGAGGFKTLSSNDTKKTLKERYAKEISRLAKKLHQTVTRRKYLNPSILSLAVFRIQQKYRANPEIANTIDYRYWERNGWTDQKMTYYFDHESNPIKIFLSHVLAKIIMALF